MSFKISPCTTVCRICLAIDAPTIPLTGTPLQAVFQKLTSTALHTYDQRPVAACYICYHQLKKSYKLTQMSAKAENILTDIFTRCNKITKQSISLVNTNAQSLNRYLCISNVDFYSYDSKLSPPEKKNNDLEIEVKVEVKDEVQDNNETEMFEEEIEADLDSVDAEPLLSVTEHHTTISVIKEENPDDGTSVYTTETHIQEKPEELLIPRESISQRRHECNICLNRYKTRYHLDRHLLVHSDKKPFKCLLCVSRFRTKYHMDNHLLAIHKKNRDPYKCVLCGSKFTDRTQFRKHVRTHVYECDVCQKKISNKQDLIYHVRTHAGERFECNICQVSFSQKSSLLYHLKKHQNGKPVERKLIKCIICNAEVIESDLKVHSRIHKKDLKCNVCQQSFKKYSLLVEHVRKHTGERPFECNQCHKRFSTKPNLKSHVNSHSGEKPHKCSLCPYASQKSSQLKTHMRTHTGEKAFECSICQRRFRHKHVLNLHMRTHTGEKPYKCPLCEERFIDSSYIQRHILKTHNV